MPVYALGDREPEIHPDAYVHPDAVVIGRVKIGAESTVWPGAVLPNRVRVGARSVVGAQAPVPEDTQIPNGSIALGVPAHVRPVDPGKHQEWIDFAVREYVDNRRVHAKDPRLMSAGTNA